MAATFLITSPDSLTIRHVDSITCLSCLLYSLSSITNSPQFISPLGFLQLCLHLLIYRRLEHIHSFLVLSCQTCGHYKYISHWPCLQSRKGQLEKQECFSRVFSMEGRAQASQSLLLAGAHLCKQSRNTPSLVFMCGGSSQTPQRTSISLFFGCSRSNFSYFQTIIWMLITVATVEAWNLCSIWVKPRKT